MKRVAAQSSLADHDSFSETVHCQGQGRRHRGGLTAVEKGCFRRVPVPSPDFEAREVLKRTHSATARADFCYLSMDSQKNVARRQTVEQIGIRTLVEAAEEAEAHALPSFGAPHPLPNGVSGRRRRGAIGVPQNAFISREQEALDTQALQLSQILGRIYPTCSESASSGARGGDAHTDSSPQLGAADLSSTAKSFCLGATAPAGSLAAALKAVNIDVKCDAPGNGDAGGAVDAKGGCDATEGPGAVPADAVKWDFKSAAASMPAGVDLDLLRNSLQLLKREIGLLEAALSARKSKGLHHNRAAKQDEQLLRSTSMPALASHHGVLPALPGTTAAPGAGYRHLHHDDNYKDMSLRDFRRRLMDAYNSINEAFDVIDIHPDRMLYKREWNSTLHQAHVCSMREANKVFELIDENGDGGLTLTELQFGIECVAPVQSVEGLRKRLICLGFRTMPAAIHVMTGGSEEVLMKCMTFSEFSNALRKIYVVEPREFRVLFDAVRDPTDINSRASICDLAAALAIVSPSFVLEDMRDRVIRRIGNVDETQGPIWDALGPSWGEELVSAEEFQEKAADRLGMAPNDAMRAFQLMDFESRGTLSRRGLMAALNLSGPCLQLEDLRRQVRQSYRSINTELQKLFGHSGEDLDDKLGLSAHEFIDALKGLEISKCDTSRIYEAADVGQRGRLTLAQFFRAVRLLVPSCALAGFHRAAVNEALPKSMRRNNLDQETFCGIMEGLGIRQRDAELTFNVLDWQDRGALRASEVVVALNHVQPGTRERVAQSERERKAERNVRAQMAPFHKTVNELKVDVRQGLADSHNLTRSTVEELTKNPDAKGRRKGKHDTADAEGAGKAEVRLPKLDAKARPPSLPPSTADDDPQSSDMRNTFYKIRLQAKAVPQASKSLTKACVEPLRGYFKDRDAVLKEHEPLLEKSFSKQDFHKQLSVLHQARTHERFRH